MKGFKDDSGKFRPINNSKSSKLKSQKTIRSSGIKIESGIRKKRTKPQGIKEWGFDLTDFEPEGFQKVLRGLDIKEGDMTVDDSGRLTDGTPYNRGFVWKGNGIEIETVNNPITGQYIRPEQREPEKNYASYIGITGEPDKVDLAVKLIKKHSGNKDESPNRRDFV